jgi:FAD/FMN-containing dehydrogenase
LRALQEHHPGIARGNGRSYGDVCLNPGGFLWDTIGLDHLTHWNPGTGVLGCEAGVLLRDIQRAMVPQGWMLPVTPGTQLVTAGGAIANDVHGKNHHVLGSFGDHVRRLWLARTDGTLIECSPTQNAHWFEATVGGMGLTGVIVRAELQLRPVAGPWLDVETIPYHGLDEFFALAEGSELNWEHTVAWIDCLASPAVGVGVRGIFMRASPSVATQGPRSSAGHWRMAFTPPFSLVNRWTLRSLNTAYYHLQRWQAGRAVLHYEPFSYPLDELQEWNRMYGPKGFYQYQSVVPPSTARDATHSMLQEIARSGEGSFLAVLKTFGQRRAPGMLSFCRPGTTLALDFPNRGGRTERLFERLDAIVLEAGGALYPAKDARMPRRMFEAGYPRLHGFLPLRDAGVTSAMSRRLFGS